MNLLKSIIAQYRNFKIAHFDKFEGRNLRKLRELHIGKRCFIIGNGPSLSASDLTQIHDSGYISFAFNRIFYIFKDTSWRPTYYISQDEKMLAGCVNEVNAIKVKQKFIPIEMEWYYDIHLKNITPFHIVTSKDVYPDFSKDVSKYIANSATVVYTAIQFAVYMGIREIYLLGVDHHFHISQNANGEIVVDSTAKDYFMEAYNKDKEQLYIPNPDKSTYTYIVARQYADAHGVKIYNATRGGKLEVFERVDFDSLFQ